MILYKIKTKIMNYKATISIIALLMCLSGCTLHSQEIEPVGKVNTYFAALNNSDYDLINELISEEIELFSIQTDTINLIANNKEDFISHIMNVDRAMRKRQVEIVDFISIGYRISVMTNSKPVGSNTHIQTNQLEIFEFKGGLIERIWIYQ